MNRPHVAKIKKAGQRFEVAIDPEKALEFRSGKILDIKEVLKDIHIYTDVQKGERPSEDELRKAFGTVNQGEIAATILQKGEIQTTTAQRSEMHEAKKRQILDLLHLWGVDPRSKAPHPVARLESAFEEAKIKVDDRKSAQEQVEDVIKELAPILPIKIEHKKIKLSVPKEYAQQARGHVARVATIVQEQWLSDGGWEGTIEIPGGMEPDLYDELNRITHGQLIAQHIQR